MLGDEFAFKVVSGDCFLISQMQRSEIRHALNARVVFLIC
jgi:hypothetical protein